MRTDVWAFGCVLYEMLTGRPAFAGRSVSEVVAAVLRDDPDWDALPAGGAAKRRSAASPLSASRSAQPPPAHRRCTSRSASRRTSRRQPPQAPVAACRSRRARDRDRRLRSIAALGALRLAGARLGQSPPNRPARLSLELPARLTLANEFSAPFAIAPAGPTSCSKPSRVATQQLYVRELTDPAVRALAGTEGARQPFFSADGAWIGFFANRKLSKVPVGGGPVLLVADIGSNPRGGCGRPTARSSSPHRRPPGSRASPVAAANRLR